MNLRKFSANRSSLVLKYFAFLIIAVFAIIAGNLVYEYNDDDFITVEGKGYKWREFNGQWLVVNYFAEWCAPCLREVPELNQWAKLAANQNMSLLGLSYDLVDAHESERLVLRYNIEFPLIVSGSVKNNPLPLPPYLPMTYIVDPEGIIVDKIAGEITAELLMQRLNEAKLK